MPVRHGVFEKYAWYWRGVAIDYIAVDCGSMAGIGKMEKEIVRMETQKLIEILQEQAGNVSYLIEAAAQEIQRLKKENDNLKQKMGEI